jgi:PAS domain S-box-containing protein
MKRIKEQLYNVELELQEQKSMLDAVLDAVPDCISVLGPNYEVIRFNKGSLNVFNITEEQTKGKKCYEILGRTSPCEVCLTKKVLETKKPIRQENYYPETKLWADISVTPVLDENGEVIRVVEHYYDITARKEIEEEIKESYNKMEQFAYVVSHDLQEPLRVVSSYCQLLEESLINKLDTEQTQYLSFIIKASARMKKLIKDLLEFAKIGQIYNDFETIDLNNILVDVITDFQLAIKETGAEIKIGEMPLITGSKTRLRQVFHNLISNAIKFRKKDQKTIIEIGYCDDDKCWTFYVKDNGIGIATEHYDKLFGVFKRLHSVNEYPGTGIGLAICKQIIESHDGQIWVDSDFGVGTTFLFFIPKDLKNEPIAK